MYTFGEVIAQKRIEHNLSQKELAALMNIKGHSVNFSSISKWEKNINRPNVMQFFTLCELLEISNINAAFHIAEKSSPSSLLNEEGQKKADEYINLLIKSGLYSRQTKENISARRKLRLYDLPVSAGTGEFLDSDTYMEIEVGNEVSSQADFGVRIAGNSMEPQFVNGQTVWIHQQPTLNSGEIGIFSVDGTAYCKLFELQKGSIRLLSLNKSYAPIMVSETASFKIFGKVVG